MSKPNHSQNTPLSRRTLASSLALGGSALAAALPASMASVRTPGRGDMEAQMAIERLLYQYGVAVDYLDAPAFADCFAPGGSLVNKVGDQNIVVEGEGLANQVMEIHRKITEHTMHIVLNHVHTVAGSSAFGITYGIATWIVKGDNGNQTQLNNYMRYIDELVFQKDRWLFMKRRMEGLFVTKVPLDQFLAEPRSGHVPPGVTR